MPIWFSNLVTNFFVNPGLAAGGMALVASPIIIHLLNRLRFRRVRFAAMEFLLASQKRHKRRILIEQLLLLLLRILIVLALVALIARLILDPRQMALLGGARAHHVVLLDDSGSMHNRWGETTAFQQGVEVIRELVREGATRPNTQEFSLLLLSNPEQPLFTRERVNRDFVNRLETTLENLQPTHQSLDLVAGLEAARGFLAEEKAGMKHLHVISDVRQEDWLEQEAVVKGVESLDESGVTVNLVRTVERRHPNLAVTGLEGDTHVAAAGVPLRLSIKVKNFDPDQPAENVRVAVFADGEKLPLNVVFDKIEAGEEEEKQEDIDSFDEPGPHTLHVTLEPDALPADNTRYLSVDVAPVNRVLLIDGSPEAEEAFYIELALTSGRNTGFEATVESPQYLGRNPLEEFTCIYLLNVPELPPDAVLPLKDYVSAGGGLVWFAGDAVNPAYYNDKLYPPDERGGRLFPVPLAPASRELVRDDFTLPGPDLVLARPYHAIFEKLVRGQVNPLIEAVTIYEYQPVADDWNRDDAERKDGVTTFGSLRNKQPVMFEHRYGRGKVITFLTTAGLNWNDWAINRSYTTVMFDMSKYLAEQDERSRSRTVGGPIRLTLDPAVYTGQVEIAGPSGPPVQLEAAPRTIGGSTDGESGNPQTEVTPQPSAEEEQTRLVASYRDTAAPGVYRVRLLDQGGGEEQRLVAYNVPLEESSLQLAADEELRKRVGPDVDLQIQEAGSLQWIEGEEAGREIRDALLMILAAALLLEQFLAYVFSYHPKTAPAAT